MKPENIMDRAYELLEEYDFSELSQEDKIYILSVMKENEYNSMRETIVDTKNLFTADTDSVIFERTSFNQKPHHTRKNSFVKLITYPVPLYKIAAMLVVLLGIYFLSKTVSTPATNSLVSHLDTLVIFKKDTIFMTKIDTIRLLEKQVVYLPQKRIEKEKRNKSLANLRQNNCNTEVCPENVERLLAMDMNGNAIGDTILKDFAETVQ